MRVRVQAFTLPELLTVLAIFLVLASLLFPVFSAAKESARKTACLSNFRQGALAMSLYHADYEDRFMPARYRPGAEANSMTDRTWVQVLLPYMRNFGVFQCPSDFGKRPTLDASFDQDLVPGDTESRYYSASQRSNLGYNYLYLSPVVRTGDKEWGVATRSSSMAADPSNTIVFVDSVWARDENGVPYGGGNYLVVPPCRYAASGSRRVDTFALNEAESERFLPSMGWDVLAPTSSLLYGGTWPWHSGSMTVAKLDGGVRAMNPGHITAGCRAKVDWTGDITNPSAYPWDLR